MDRGDRCYDDRNKIIHHVVRFFALFLLLGATYDSRGFQPYIVSAIPNQTSPSGSSVTFNPTPYIKCGPYSGSGGQSWGVTGLTGLTINPSTGIISGTMSANSSSVVVSCTNTVSNQSVSSTAFSWTSATAAAGRFVDCSAVTNGSGTSASPWNSLASVAGMTTGMDLWLKESTTCTPSTSFNVSWSGTVSDPVVMGAYYLSGGTAYQGLTNYGDILNPASSDWGSRPRVTGTYLDSCRPNCSWSNDGTPQVPPAVPSNRNSGLIRVDGGSVYVVVQDIASVNSAGACFRSDAPGSILSPTVSNNTFRRVVADHCADGGISMLDQTFGTIRDSRVNLTALEWADGKMTNWPHGIVISRAAVAMSLIENNTATNTYGEGFGLGGGSFGIMRLNKAANNRRIAIYPAQFADAVVEQNISVSSPLVDSACAVGSPCESFTYFNDCLNNTHEEDGQPASGGGAVRVLMRNNLCAMNSASTASGFAMGNAQADADIQQVGGWLVGNTLITSSTTNKTVTVNSGLSLSSGKVDFWRSYNNLNIGSGVCSMPTNSLFTLGSNYWTTQPTDTDCRGTGDVNGGSSGISGTFTSVSAINFPLYTAFRPSGGVGANAGVTRVTTVLTDPNWSTLYSRATSRSECQSALSSFAVWAQELSTDYCGTTRGASPDLGAFEQ